MAGAARCRWPRSRPSSAGQPCPPPTAHGSPRVGVGAGPFYGFADLPGADAQGVGRPFPLDEEYVDEERSRLASTPAMARSS
ncbi:MAG: hypothetical protein R3F43_31665 [bacterium]